MLHCVCVCACVQAKEVQEELAIDMKILQELLAQTDDEEEKLARRKKELNEEMQCYCSYLEEQKREEERREKELDAMVQAEVGRLMHKDMQIQIDTTIALIIKKVEYQWLVCVDSAVLMH